MPKRKKARPLARRKCAMCPHTFQPRDPRHINCSLACRLSRRKETAKVWYTHNAEYHKEQVYKARAKREAS